MQQRYYGSIPENETWTPYTIVGAELGAGHADIPCHVAVGVRGDRLWAWAHVHFAGMSSPVIISASANLKDIENALGAEALRALNLEDLRDELAVRQAIQLGGDAQALLGGRSARRAKRKRRRERIKAKLKSVAKKIGKSKVFKGIAKVAKKIVNNPLVKGVLAVVPGGQAVLAAQAAGKLAARAIKGGKKARKAISAIHSSYKRGNPKAGRMLGMVRKGLQAHLKRGGRFGKISGDDLEGLEDGQAFALLAGECLGQIYAGPIGIGGDEILGADPNDDRAATLEADALHAFADDGPQWAPLRQALSDMTPGAARPGMSARETVNAGRLAQAERYQLISGRNQPWDVQDARGRRYRAA